MSMPIPENPRAVIGDNAAPDYAKIEVDRLADEYAQMSRDVTAFLDEARAVPAKIENDEVKGIVTSLIKRGRDMARKLNGFHEVEKQPHFRRGQGADQFFFGLEDKIAKRNKNANNGATDILQARLTDYDNRVLAAEQERRRLEAEQAAREEAGRLAAAREAERVAEEARQTAERARAPEKIEEKTVIAAQAEQVASTAKVEAVVAAGRAEDAHIATLAKPADIMRRRGDDGTLSTMGQETYAEMFDRTKLDFTKLGPYFAIAAVEVALRAWAKSTDYRTPMDGASIGRRNKSIVR